MNLAAVDWGWMLRELPGVWLALLRELWWAIVAGGVLAAVIEFWRWRRGARK